MIVDRIRDYFTTYHQQHQRQIANRDKAIYPNGWGNYKNRFYVTPTKSQLIDKHYEPDADTSWQFVLYRTPILTVHPDDTATMQFKGWFTDITFVHLFYLLNKFTPPMHEPYYVDNYKPNKWTKLRFCIRRGDYLTSLFDGLTLNLTTGEFLNPQPLMKYVLPLKHPEVVKIRKAMTVVRERYIGIARLHQISIADHQKPFKGQHAISLGYEELIAETEPKISTYLWLSGEYAESPLKLLDKSLQEIKNYQYRPFLVREEV